MTAGIAALKANSQANPVDVILPSRLLSPSWVLGCAEGEAVAQDHKQRSLFLPLGTKRQKKDQGVAQALAPGPRIANQGGFARSIMQTE